MQDLEKAFRKVGLQYRDADHGFEGNDHVFGIDISGDYFTAWVPEGVIAQVQAQDKRLSQVVLMVKEPQSTFRTEIWAFERFPRDKVLREWFVGRNKKLLVERGVLGGTRHFLCGTDEHNHPFIAQLPRCATSIRMAHDLLKPPEVRGKRVRGKGKNIRSKGDPVYRQGEWFFLPVSGDISDQLNQLAPQRNISIVGGRGNPHMVDERIVLRSRYGMDIYIRGKVRHVEHKTLTFRDWVRVVRNRELGGSAGGTWID